MAFRVLTLIILEILQQPENISGVLYFGIMVYFPELDKFNLFDA